MTVVLCLYQMGFLAEAGPVQIFVSNNVFVFYNLRNGFYYLHVISKRLLVLFFILNGKNVFLEKISA